jgi:dienelactone hydrolase
VAIPDHRRRRRRKTGLVSYPRAIGRDVWWQQRLPAEEGRVTVVHLGADSKQCFLLPGPWNARTRVHEYGGLSYLPVPAREGTADGTAIVFANYADQRLYLLESTGADGQDGGGGPRPLTPEPDGSPEQPSLRYADFTLSPDRSEVWCVQERHYDGKVARAIVAVPLDGSAAESPDSVRELVTGSDFYAFPTPSPDGKRLAWICWNHPRMPWDGTELRVALIEDGAPGQGRLVKGGMQESVLAPLWRDASSLYVVTDWPGWWNIYQVGLVGQPPQALYPAEEEFAGPLWQLGERPYAMLGDGRLAVLHGCGGMRLGLLDPETGELADLDIPYPVFASGLSADGCPSWASRAARRRRCRSSGWTPLPPRWRCSTRRRTPFRTPATCRCPVRCSWRALRAHGARPGVPAGQPGRDTAGRRAAPYVVWVHGGPTSHATALLDIEKAYFTSRGIGIVDVNYGGSTGYGRRYRERLRRQWGVVDVEDAIAAARALARDGEADGARLAIRGRSAGGWTALAAVTAHSGSGPVFGAAVSYFGIADLRGLAAQTHDFESRYLDGLIGPLPAYEMVYLERSPVGHLTEATCPILLLQGLDDPVVPPAQSEAIAADLAAHGIRHAYLSFKGESHGFRRAETVIACLEAELSFYGQILGFSPPGIPAVAVVTGRTR